MLGREEVEWDGRITSAEKPTYPRLIRTLLGAIILHAHKSYFCFSLCCACFKFVVCFFITQSFVRFVQKCFCGIFILCHHLCVAKLNFFLFLFNSVYSSRYRPFNQLALFYLFVCHRVRVGFMSHYPSLFILVLS